MLPCPTRQPGAASSSFLPQPSRPGRIHPSRTRLCAAQHQNSSFDAEDDLDTDLAEELSKFRSPETWGKVARHLDLVWQVGRSRGSRSMCTCCSGSGEEECTWCHGTGALMVGDRLFRSQDGSSHCPVCKGKGCLPCENCRGTGYRASWLGGPNSCKNPT